MCEVQFLKCNFFINIEHGIAGLIIVSATLNLG
jgi:hypothetical protein